MMMQCRWLMINDEEENELSLMMRIQWWRCDDDDDDDVDDGDDGDGDDDWRC